MKNNSYKWTLKNYPNTSTLLYTNNSYTFRIEIVTYERPVKNSKWIETARKIELVNNEFYFNTVEAIPFFRNIGGREIVKMNYTKFGYIPVRINSINQDSTKKVERRFIFE